MAQNIPSAPMKKCIFLILLIFVLALGSCSKAGEEKRYTPEEAQRISDSTLKAQMLIQQKQAAEDLEYRKTIELHSRHDSIETVEEKK